MRRHRVPQAAPVAVAARATSAKTDEATAAQFLIYDANRYIIERIAISPAPMSTNMGSTRQPR